jgi:hypothetical protein
VQCVSSCEIRSESELLAPGLVFIDDASRNPVGHSSRERERSRDREESTATAKSSRLARSS